MNRTRNKRTGAEETAQDGEIRHDVTDSEAVPDDLAAAAVAERQAARDADEQAVRCRAEAGSVVSISQAEAERIIREGQAKALPLIADAIALERKAADLGGRSKHLEHAARQEALAGEQEALAADLTAELERATETIAALDSKLSQLGEDRERLETAVAAARVAGDVSLIAEGRRQLNATVEATEGLGEQRADVMARVRPIGDGTETGPGLLLDALAAAETHRTAVTEALDELYPDRPGAEHRRDLDNLKNVLAGNLARIEQEAKAEPAKRRRYGFADAH